MARIGRSRPARNYKLVRPSSLAGAPVTVALTTPNVALAAPLVTPSTGTTVALTTPNVALAAPLVTPSGGGTVALTAPNVALAAPAVTTTGGSAQFPGSPLGTKVEILINGTWTDITGYVYQRNDIVITRGLPNETQSVTPSQMTLTVNNRSGNFSPKNSSGAWYPYLVRNTQIRVSVNATSTASVSYSGYRFWGEIYSFAPQWDVTGNDAYVNITASGPFRRLIQGASTASIMKQTLLSLTGIYAPVALWPCEDTGGTTLASAVPGVGAITFTGAVPNLGVAQPLGAATLPLPSLNGSKWHGVIPSYTGNGAVVMRFVYNGESIPAGDAPLAAVYTTGTVNALYAFAYTDGGLGIAGYNSVGTQLFGSGEVSILGSGPLWVSLELQQVGGNVQCSLITLAAGAASADSSGNYNVSGTLGIATDVYVNTASYTSWGSTAVLGMISVQGAWESMYNFVNQLDADNGEYAADRVSRLCSGANLNFSLTGTNTDTPKMGPQQVDTLMNVLQSCADMDRGQLYETRGQLGVGYRTRVNLQNQSPALTASYTGATLSQVPQPVEDDQYVVNYMTVTRNGGSSATYSLASGAMSVQDPPNGAGLYQNSATAYAYSDSQLANLAQWIVTLGTVDEYRFPQLTFSMARPQVASLFAAIPGLDIGDYIEVTSPPSFLQPGAIKQLVLGYTESINARKWDITFNCVPESPYTGGSLPTW